MAKIKPIKVPKEINDALKRFPKVVKTQERRAIEQRRFLNKTFGPLVRQLNRNRKER